MAGPRIVALRFVLVFAVLMGGAPRLVAQECQARVVFSNGILTLEDDARYSRDQLRIVVNEALRLQGRDELPFYCLDYAYASSRVNGVRAYIQDIAESYAQIQLNRVAEIVSDTGQIIADVGESIEIAVRTLWSTLGGLAGRVPLPDKVKQRLAFIPEALNKIDQFVQERTNELEEVVRDVFFAVGNLQFVLNPDLAAHVGKYRSLLGTTTGPLVIVAHSQGNLFANGAFAALTTGADGLPPVSSSRLGIVSVATPDSSVAGGGDHTTLFGDLILAVRLIVPDQLPANTDVDGSLCEPFPFSGQVPGRNAVLCHSFLKSYLLGIFSQPRIINQIIDAILEEAPPTLGSPWPMFQQNPQHTGRSGFIGAQTSNVKWRFNLADALPPELAGEFFPQPPLVAADGTVYVAMAIWSIGASRLVAINSQGALLNPDAPFFPGTVDTDGTSAIGPDGTIYVWTYNALVALRPDGTPKWSLPAPLGSSPTIASDGTIYTSSGNEIWAVRPDGAFKWRRLTVAGIPVAGSLGDESAFAEGPDGSILVMTVILGANTAALESRDPDDGSLNWRFDLGLGLSFFARAPVTAEDGTTIVVGRNELRAITPAGTLKWQRFFIGGASSAPTIAADGTILLSTAADVGFVGPNPVVFSPAMLQAFNLADGAFKWSVMLSDDPDARGWLFPPQIGIGGDGTIYVLLRPSISSTRCGGFSPPGPCQAIPVLQAFTPDGVLRWSHGATSSWGLAIGTGATTYALLDDSVIELSDGVASRHAVLSIYAFGQVVAATVPP